MTRAVLASPVDEHAAAGRAGASVLRGGASGQGLGAAGETLCGMRAARVEPCVMGPGDRRRAPDDRARVRA